MFYRMESRTRILILCLLYIVRASQVLAEESEFRARFPRAEDVKDLSRLDTLMQEINGIDRQSAYKLRDKRALGFLLSGLAQIFGYTVTPIQIASLPNPMNITRSAAMSNSSMMGNVVMGQQTASTRPTSMNATAPAPRQQETIRFTGVLNFGNNSDIVGHLQRYEQIFHGRQNNATDTTTTISRPVSMPMPPAKISADPTTNSVTRPPLLAPFFVRIPLPIAPDLPPATMPIENFKFSYPAPAVSIESESNEAAEMPVRKEQETIYRNKENTVRYTVEEKDIYDEKDVMKPVNHHIHQLYIDEPSSRQNDKQQRKQKERIERLKEQEEQRSCDKNTYHKENVIKEKDRNRKEEIANRNREEEIANENREKEIANRNREEKIANQNQEEESDNRNREYPSKYKSTEKKKPTYNDKEDEDSAERYEEHISRANKSSKQPLREAESEEVEEDDSNEQFRGYKQPENFDKYIEMGYNQQLPIGDYFHKGDPEVIRDSYGEILDDKKLEDDRIAGYINMFKHPYIYNPQSVRNPEDASEENEKEPSTADGYDEHLIRLQKLKEEYALPKMKYEEYDLNDESEEKRDDRDNERIQNRTSTRSKTGRVRGKQNNRAKMPTGSSKDILRDDGAKFENTKSQEESGFVKHIPLIVPIRYIDTNDKVQQATTRQLSYEESDKLPNVRLPADNVDSMQTLANKKLIPQIGLPERPRKLHEGEHKELQVWPPPFDYAFDNTAPTNTIISPNSQNYPSNYYQHVKNIAADDANSDNSSEQRYLVVVGNPYQYPYNVYYFPNEDINPQNHPHPNTENTYQQNQIHAPQQNINQQFTRANSNLIEHNLNETTRDHYHQPHQVPINVLDRYRYIVGESTPEAKGSVNIDTRDQIPNVENWSSRIYQSRSRAEQSPPVLAQLQNVASSNQNVHSRSSNSRYLRPVRRQKRSRSEDQSKDDKKVKILQPIPTSKPFDDPQSAHDFFGFNKDDYSFTGESSDALKVAEENGKIAKESDMPLDPVVYHHDNESVMKHADEPENDTEKAKVTEYRNNVATLKVSEQRQLKPNGPIHYVEFVRNI
ncbi:uncharacterized protein DDB_G0283697 [Polyergus mexicanus]|uniref:uncharacterized protein DDB_G0283697 n=1 Tax=Polyergus mexicanus TaxID=615972 RepID=UPI0038B5CFED